ncbi:MAG: hypothetical protein H6667_09075 [Ardenticatenaceae bacterium]|nr:hypothetical protein [Ardenticatenaceae bacterium]MCB9445201.1 hypothetical protein [Ardenticatenaceae bacterium]
MAFKCDDDDVWSCYRPGKFFPRAALGASIWRKIYRGWRISGAGAFSTGVFFAPFLWFALFIYMLGSGMSAFIFPTLTTLSVERMSSQEAGKLLGVTSAVGSVMNIIGSLCAGLAYDYIMVGSPFWMGAIVLFVAAYLLSQTGLCASIPDLFGVNKG